MPDFDEDITITRNGSVQARFSRNGNIRVGGNGFDGDFLLYPTGASSHSDSEATVWIDAQRGNLMLGGPGADGDIGLFPAGASYSQTDWSEATVWLNGQEGNLMLGGNGKDGDIALFPSSATISQSSFDAATIHLDGDRGDIILRNADCAEDFSFAEMAEAEPGTVMVAGPDGALLHSESAYDTRVVGVVAGAGQYRPGIVLDRQAEDDDARRGPIALMGKTCVKVTDENGPIGIGDLLVTSSTPGHAMKAGPMDKSFGAVIGKALEPLEAGTGMIAMLICLQ